MKILLDTCTFFWIIEDSANLSTQCKKSFTDPNNEVYLSVISLWEIMIKYQLGKLPLPEAPDIFIPKQRDMHAIMALTLDEAAIWQLERLPDYHKDPFDRMLIAQAIAHSMVISTPDEKITQYPIRTLW